MHQDRENCYNYSECNLNDTPCYGFTQMTKDPTTLMCRLTQLVNDAGDFICSSVKVSLPDSCHLKYFDIDFNVEKEVVNHIKFIILHEGDANEGH